MVEKVVFAVMMVIALGAGVLGGIYEIGGRRKADAERKNAEDGSGRLSAGEEKDRK